MTPLFETIVKHVQPPQVDLEGPLQMQVSQLDYNSYVGVIGIGRIARGRVKTNTQVAIVDHRRNKRQRPYPVDLRLPRPGARRSARGIAGDIIVFTGIEGLLISRIPCAIPLTP